MPDRYALILGSGCSELDGGEPLQTPRTGYGDPSAPLRRRRIGSVEVLTLARHGDDHSIAPHAINYRANVAALADARVTAIIALNTVGVITDACGAGSLALPDQLIDYTWGREQSFGRPEGGGVRHIDFTEPFSARLRDALQAAAAAAAIDCHAGGVYAATQGPRLETAAEIDRLERDGADFVGMTAMPEAALAAEADIDYASLALCVNAAAGRSERPIHDEVTANSERAVAAAVRLLETFFDRDGAS